MDNKRQQIEKNLIQKIKNRNCNESLIELTERHTPLCWKIYGNFSAALNNLGFSAEDVMGERFDVTYRAAKNFKFTRKIRFCTYFGCYFRFHILNIIKDNQKYLSMEPEVVNSFVEKPVDLNKNKEDFDYVFNILSKLKDKRVLKIYKLRYNKKNKFMTWSEIAKKTGQSTQNAINIHEKYLKLLKSKLESKTNLDVI